MYIELYYQKCTEKIREFNKVTWSLRVQKLYEKLKFIKQVNIFKTLRENSESFNFHIIMNFAVIVKLKEGKPLA